MNNAVGAADIEAMLQDGIAVGLGTDGFSHNMWAEWKTAYLLHKAVHRDPQRAPGDMIARMATEHNAALASHTFGLPLGRVEMGAVADLILVDYHPFTPLTAGNLPWHILFGFEASMVDTTVCNGQVLMRHRRLTTLDEASVAADALRLAPDVWARTAAMASTSVSY